MARNAYAANRAGCVSVCAPARRYLAGMENTDLPKPAPDTDRPDPTQYVPSFAHLMLIDRRTPEEQWAAMIKEANRRKGRGRSRWWEKA